MEDVRQDSDCTSEQLHETEAVTGSVLQKKMFLEISQNSQENTCVQAEACNFI